jgi:hypothetical protein
MGGFNPIIPASLFERPRKTSRLGSKIRSTGEIDGGSRYNGADEFQTIENPKEKKMRLSALFLTVTLLAPGALQAQTTAAKSLHSPKPAQSAAPPSFQQDGNIRTPLAAAEDQYYQRAFPIKKSHALASLLLMGFVLLSIFGFLIRTMAKSQPRKQTPK